MTTIAKLPPKVLKAFPAGPYVTKGQSRRVMATIRDHLGSGELLACIDVNLTTVESLVAKIRRGIDPNEPLTSSERAHFDDAIALLTRARMLATLVHPAAQQETAQESP